MRKRKFPVVLVSFLAILIGGTAFMNYKSAPVIDDHGQEQQAPPAEEAPLQVASTPNNAKTTEDLKKGLGASTKPGAPVTATKVPAPEGRVIMRSSAPAKRGPGDSAASGQWYTEDSYVTKKDKPKGK